MLQLCVAELGNSFTPFLLLLWCTENLFMSVSDGETCSSVTDAK